ncbi:MAG: zf-HC2 domain-containing protein [Blastocatellia bacterium]|nr:zf-HC2 domain-containing protein [Blastocatellia bacterium]
MTMKECQHIQLLTSIYLDDELQNGERDAFETHLSTCAACRALVDQERAWLGAVRSARPLYQAPAELRARIEKNLAESSGVWTAPAELRRKLNQMLPQAAFPWQSRWPVRLPALALVLVVLIGVSWWWEKTHSLVSGFPKPSEFALMAVETHIRRLNGKLPLEFESNSPVAISDWFAGKVTFSLKLPNYQESSGQNKLYSLEGARLVALRNDYAAYVAYRMQKRPITLVVTTSAIAAPEGGEPVVSKGVTFHCDAVNGYKVITWSDRGLTYALVSDLEERGQQSCIVCHAGTKDRDFIEGLRPR